MPPVGSALLWGAGRQMQWTRLQQYGAGKEKEPAGCQVNSGRMMLGTVSLTPGKEGRRRRLTDGLPAPNCPPLPVTTLMYLTANEEYNGPVVAS